MKSMDASNGPIHIKCMDASNGPIHIKCMDYQRSAMQ
jgi:hypothetical protein